MREQIIALASELGRLADREGCVYATHVGQMPDESDMRRSLGVLAEKANVLTPTALMSLAATALFFAALRGAKPGEAPYRELVVNRPLRVGQIVAPGDITIAKSWSLRDADTLAFRRNVLASSPYRTDEEDAELQELDKQLQSAPKTPTSVVLCPIAPRETDS